MQKFFIEENQKKEETIEIIGEDVNHISNVLRMKIGEQILIGNSKSLETYLTQIEKIEKEKVIVKIIEKLDIQTEPNVEIDLYQGLPKADKMELIVQKTTEVGVNNIIPVDMARCIVKLDEKDAKKKIERWQKVAESAAKQSKRSKIPEVKNKIKIKDLEELIEKYDIFIVAYEEEKCTKLKEVLRQNNEKAKQFEQKESSNKCKIGVLVGPEGGIAPEEVENLKKWKAKIVTLGNRILRTETAPIVLVSNIIYEFEE